MMLEDINAFVQVAEAGSITNAAERLFRTPSAVTRQIQRLELALGAELLDRDVKPPRLTPLGWQVLAQSRTVLHTVNELRMLARPESPPKGLFRVGVSHAITDTALVDPIKELCSEFPEIFLRFVHQLTPNLFDQLLAGKIDAAVVILPEGQRAPAPLITHVVDTDDMIIVEHADGNTQANWPALAACSWVLDPPGCWIRESLLSTVKKNGFSLKISTEIHNHRSQLAFVEAGQGLGVLPKRFVNRYSQGGQLRDVTPIEFELKMTIAVVKSNALGTFDKVADALRGLIVKIAQE